MEGELLLAGAQVFQRAEIRVAGGRGVAEHLHVAAQRQQRQLPVRAGTVDEAPDLLAEAERKGLDLHTTTAGHEIMPELMDEHDDADDDEKRHHVVQYVNQMRYHSKIP